MTRLGSPKCFSMCRLTSSAAGIRTADLSCTASSWRMILPNFVSIARNLTSRLSGQLFHRRGGVECRSDSSHVRIVLRLWRAGALVPLAEGFALHQPGDAEGFE